MCLEPLSVFEATDLIDDILGQVDFSEDIPPRLLLGFDELFLLGILDLLLLRSKRWPTFFRPLLGQFLVLLLYPNGLLGHYPFQDFFVGGRSLGGKAEEKIVP